MHTRFYDNMTHLVRPEDFVATERDAEVLVRIDVVSDIMSNSSGTPSASSIGWSVEFGKIFEHRHLVGL